MSRIFLLFLVSFFSFFSFCFGAENNALLVENVAVSVTGKSPSDARNMAVATARRDAFLILLTRLEINTNLADNISNEEISDMVRSEQIDGEKIARNTYSATFNITFAKDFVDHTLAQKNLTKLVPKTSENYLLIPVKVVKNQMILWEENNDWKRAVEKNLNKKLSQNEEQKFIVPEGDLSNIATINRNNISFASYAELEPLISKYNSSAAYTLFFSYDEIENKVSINVFYIRKLQKKQIRLSFINVDRLDYQSLLDKVASKTIEYLINSQKPENVIAASSLIRIQIPIANLASWLEIKNKIENSGLISQLNVESISRDYGVISVNYLKGDAEVIPTFLGLGINLQQKSENFYTLNIN